MLDREHADHHAARGDDRERVVSARQAAEALFAPKPQTLKQPEVRSGPSDDPQPRQPRILGISAREPRQPEDAGPSPPATATTQKRIAYAEATRVRTWVKYGMTIAQVAKVYGVTLIEVQRVLREG